MSPLFVPLPSPGGGARQGFAVCLGLLSVIAIAQPRPARTVREERDVIWTGAPGETVTVQAAADLPLTLILDDPLRKKSTSPPPNTPSPWCSGARVALLAPFCRPTSLQLRHPAGAPVEVLFSEVRERRAPPNLGWEVVLVVRAPLAASGQRSDIDLMAADGSVCGVMEGVKWRPHL